MANVLDETVPALLEGVPRCIQHGEAGKQWICEVVLRVFYGSIAGPQDNTNIYLDSGPE